MLVQGEDVENTLQEIALRMSSELLVPSKLETTKSRWKGDLEVPRNQRELT